MLKQRKQEEDGLDVVMIFATIKTPWKERTKDITTLSHGNVNLSMIKILFTWHTATFIPTQIFKGTLTHLKPIPKEKTEWEEEFFANPLLGTTVTC